MWSKIKFVGKCIDGKYTVTQRTEEAAITRQ
jgi:hypothetical protein